MINHSISKLFIFVTCTVLAVFGGSIKPEEIIGKWECTELDGQPMEKDGDFWLFRKDGSMVERIFGLDMKRTYEIKDNVLRISAVPIGFTVDVRIINLKNSVLDVILFEYLKKKMKKTGDGSDYVPAVAKKISRDEEPLINQISDAELSGEMMTFAIQKRKKDIVISVFIIELNPDTTYQVKLYETIPSKKMFHQGIEKSMGKYAIRGDTIFLKEEKCLEMEMYNKINCQKLSNFL